MGKIPSSIIVKIQSHSMGCLLFGPLEYRVGGHEGLLSECTDGFHEMCPIIAFGRSTTCTNEAWLCTSPFMRSIVAEIEEAIGQPIEIIESY